MARLTKIEGIGTSYSLKLDGAGIKTTETLLEKGLAYRQEGSVYFRVSAFDAYGKLSRLDPTQLRSTGRVDGDAYDKENARDFALWKASKEDEPAARRALGLAAFDLASALIRRDHGPLLSMEVAHLLMSRSATDPYALPLKSEDTLVNRTLTVMQGNIETPLTIRDVARKLGCSQKKIEMRVQAELRTTPQALYRRLRLTMARKLVEETEQTIAEIAGRCGYENASAMTRAFKAEFGRTPTAFRSGAPN